MLERDLQDATADLARTCGWKVVHFAPARTSKGWRTPVRYDGQGFPDLILVHPERHRVLFRELKAARGQLSPEQRDWIGCLDLAGANAGVWSPKDWAEIVDTLTFGRGSS